MAYMKKPMKTLGNQNIGSVTKTSCSPHPIATQGTSHLDPPEKGRKEWLCLEDPGANRKGSNTCREQQGQDKSGSSPCLPAMGDRIHRWEQEDGLVLTDHPLPSSRASYLWVWPHLRVVVKGINGECDQNTCGTVRKQKTNYTSGL